ncbi:Hypothetical predicted protein, partial [Paramuricea clavata]
MLTHVDKSMKEYVSLHADGITCRREYLLNYSDISKDEMKHNCCDLCAKACSCGELSCPANLLFAATTAFDEDIWKRDHAVQVYKTLDEDIMDVDDANIHPQSVEEAFQLIHTKFGYSIKSSRLPIVKMSSRFEQAYKVKDHKTFTTHGPKLIGWHEHRGECSNRVLLEEEKAIHMKMRNCQFAFSSHIKQKAIRLEEVREIVKSIPPLQSIPPKKICDKEIESKGELLKRAGLKCKS